MTVILCTFGPTTILTAREPARWTKYRVSEVYALPIPSRLPPGRKRGRQWLGKHVMEYMGWDQQKAS